MSRRMHDVAAVLFDLDGTLLDTAHDLAHALNAVRIEQALEPLAFGAIRGYVSHGSGALIRLGFPGVPEPEFTALRDRLLAVYRRALAVHTRPFAGVPELLRRLRAAGIAWGIVTNKPGWLTEPLLDELALRAEAGVVVSGDTLPERKPHPGQLLHAAQALSVAPQHCLYVGDAERDVMAARAAGMRSLVASFGYMAPTDHPRQWPADGWIDAPLELLEWIGLGAAREAGTQPP